MQRELEEDQFDAVGAQLEKALAATDACILPTEATRLRPQNSG